MRSVRLLLPLLTLVGCAAEKPNGRPWVHKIYIDGVKHVKKSDLKDKIALQATSWIPLSPKHYLDPFTVDIDRKRVEAYYAAHGYFFAHVTEATVTPRGKDGKSVDVKLVVDEGPPTVIDNVVVNGLTPLSEKEGAALQKMLEKPFRHGSVFVHDRYLERKAIGEARLQRLGFAWGTVTGEVDVNRDKRTADVIFNVSAGPRATMGSVYVRGYDTIDPRLILARAQIDKGAKFSPDLLEDARGRIYNTGAFGSVKVEYDHDAEHPEVADVVITVHEGKFRELRLGVGFDFESTRYDAHFSAEYTKHSFLGGLRTLKLRLEPGWVLLVNQASIGAPQNGPTNGPSLRADATFSQPDFVLRNFEFKWTVGYDVGIDYGYQYHGPRTSIGIIRPLWRNRITLALSYNFNYLLFFNTVPALTEDPHAAAQLYGYTNPYRVAWWQEDITIDLRNKPQDPHWGGYFATLIEEGGTYAGGAFTYEKVQPELRLYAPLGKRVTLAARGEFGQMFEQGNDGSPITRRFYLGGPNSHRGFNYDRMSIQVPLGYAGAPTLPIGGDQFVLFSAELRVDVYRLFNNWLGFTAFADAGDVAAPSTQGASLLTVLSPKSYDPGGICQNGQTPKLSTTVDLTDPHVAVGGGLRYHTIIGTIRADIGVRVNRTTPCESDGRPNPDPGSRVAFHISIGESF